MRSIRVATDEALRRELGARGVARAASVHLGAHRAGDDGRVPDVSRRRRGAAKAEGRTTRVTVPDVSVVIVTWNGRQHLDACLDAVAAQQGVSLEDDPRRQRVDGRHGAARPQPPSIGAHRLAARESWLCRWEQRGRCRRACAHGRVSQQRHRCRVQDGCGRCSPVSMQPGGFALTTSRIVYMHDPQIIDSAGDGFLRCGGRVQAPARSAVGRGCGADGSVRRLRCGVPDAESRVRGARRVRRGLLRVARGRRSVLSRAAARLPRAATCPMRSCGITGAPRSAATARAPSSTDSATSSGCISRTRRPRCCFARGWAPRLRPRGGAYFAARWTGVDVRPRQGGGAGRRARDAAQACGRSALAARRMPTPSGACSSRGWLGVKRARSGSTQDVAR